MSIPSKEIHSPVVPLTLRGLQRCTTYAITHTNEQKITCVVFFLLFHSNSLALCSRSDGPMPPQHLATALFDIGFKFLFISGLWLYNRMWTWFLSFHVPSLNETNICASWFVRQTCWHFRQFGKRLKLLGYTNRLCFMFIVWHDGNLNRSGHKLNTQIWYIINKRVH